MHSLTTYKDKALEAGYLLSSWWKRCASAIDPSVLSDPDKPDYTPVLRYLGIKAADIEPPASQIPAPMQDEQAETQHHRCADCGKEFKHQMALRQHMRLMHAPAPVSSLSFSVALDSKEGLPTCRHCGLRFRKWQGLIQHLDKDTCSERDSRRRAHAQKTGPLYPPYRSTSYLGDCFFWG